MAQSVAGTGILAELSAGGAGGSGDAVYDVLGESGGAGGIGDLDAVLSGVGGLQTASSSARRSQLGARSTGGGPGGPVGIDNLIEGGVGASGSVSIKRQGGFSLKMEQGTVSGKGSKSTARSADAISGVVNSHADAVESCYKKEARINPNLKGSISIQFTIEFDGKVTSVRVTDSTLRNKKVEACISRIVERWRFQKIDKAEGEATFRQKFIFST
jgi:TonB family protein